MKESPGRSLGFSFFVSGVVDIEKRLTQSPKKTVCLTTFPVAICTKSERIISNAIFSKERNKFIKLFLPHRSGISLLIVFKLVKFGSYCSCEFRIPGL